jgi:hypothetical protein
MAFGKLLLVPTTPYHFTLYGDAAPSRPNGHPGVGRPQSKVIIFVFGPPQTTPWNAAIVARILW